MMMIGWHIGTNFKGQDRISTLMLPIKHHHVASRAGKGVVAANYFDQCPCAAMRSLRLFLSIAF